jgi:hypothetical protein
MKQFIKSLFSSDDNSTSSKRFIAVVGSFVLFTIALCNLFFKLAIAEFIFFGILGFVSALFGLNTFLSSKAMGTKENVAQNIVNKQSDPEVSEDAKDVLNSDKPKG